MAADELIKNGLFPSRRRLEAIFLEDNSSRKTGKRAWENKETVQHLESINKNARMINMLKQYELDQLCKDLGINEKGKR